MKKLIIPCLCLAVLFFGYKSADACVDMSRVMVGSAKLSVSQRGSVLTICYKVKWKSGKASGLKFQGYRIPRGFRVHTGKHQVLTVAGKGADPRHQVVVHHKTSSRVCFKVSGVGQYVYSWSRNLKRVRKWWSSAKTASWLKKQLLTGLNKDYFKVVFRKGKKKGATLGQHRFYGDPVPRGGCGADDPKWIARKKTKPRPRAKSSDF